MAAERKEIKALLTSQGWTEDRFGNLKSKSGIVRVKFQATSLRIEKRVVYAPIPSIGYTPAPEWKNIVSDYYCNISIADDRVKVKHVTLRDLTEKENG